MKFDPSDSILSTKSKRAKRESDLKPYFENTHQIFTPSWVKYKNPSLNSENDEDEDDEDSRPKGMALLKRVYGGACWKGYTQLGMKEKQGKLVPNCIPVKGSGQTKLEKRFNEVVNNYQDVINHLEEHQAEGVGDPKDVKQSRELKKDIKRVNALHLVAAKKIARDDPLYKVSDPREVQKKAFEIYGKDAVIYKSVKPKKKYQILNKFTGKWVHFGDSKMEDFTRHQNPTRQERYLKRAMNIKGKWRQNPYSPNNLSILL
ncbi:MAG: hypothetical protein EBU90_22545, partial [Proteobacteria bacterium]|nr:hypothetical protein [Pseudomonadota bacterium]